LTVSNTTTEAVGDVAAQHSIALHELSSQQVSLEHAYLALTDDATEYRGEAR
jgi:ABC-2 type transport system ATP-binding protein